MREIRDALRALGMDPNSKLVKSQLKKYDEDGSGSLSYDEFYALMEDADLGLSAAELQLLMAEADENDDGKINYAEVRARAARGRP